MSKENSTLILFSTNLRPKTSRVWVVCTLLMLLGLAGALPAAGPLTGTWNVDSNGNWNTGSNWDTNPDFPNADKDAAIFGSVITADRIITLGQDLTVRYLTFNDNNQYTITGANTLLIDGPGANGGIITQSGSGTVVISSTVDNGAKASKIMEWTGAGTGAITLSGVVTGAAQITKNGTTTYILSGNNTFTGSVAINTGVVNIRHANALGTTVAGTTVASGAALELQGGIAVGAEALTLNGTGISSGGALRNISGNNSISGDILIQTASSIGSDSGTLTLSGVINSTGAQGFTKVGSGTVTLSGGAANTFTGATTISGGTLDLAKVGALGSTSGVTLNSGGTLLFSGTGNFVSDTAGLTMAGGTLNANNHAETMGTLTLTANSVINLVADASNADLTFSTASVGGTPVLTINNWQGVAWASGTGDKIFLTTDPGWAARQYIQFDGFAQGAHWIAGTGEIVPIPEPGTYAAGALLASLLGWHFYRRRQPR